MSKVMRSPRLFRRAEVASRLTRPFSRRGRFASLPFPLSAWTSSRDAPAPPPETFREWWDRTREQS